MNDKNFEWIRNWFKEHISTSDHEWKEFSGYFKEIVLKKNDCYLKAGGYTNKVGFLKKGILRAYDFKENGESITHYFYHLPSAPIVTLYEAFNTKTPNDLSVEALTDTVIYEIEREDLSLLEKKYPDLNQLKLIIAEKYLLYNKHRINSFQTKNAKERYVDFINTTGDLALKVPQHMIASYLGISQFTLSKIKSK